MDKATDAGTAGEMDGDALVADVTYDVSAVEGEAM